MYAITYKNKPAKLIKLHDLNNEIVNDHNEDNYFLVASTKKGAVQAYLYYFGFSWRERPKGIDCRKVAVLP